KPRAGLAANEIRRRRLVQEGDNFIHHWRSHGKTGTEDRPRKLQCEVCADALVGDEIFEAHARVRGWVVMKLDAVVKRPFRSYHARWRRTGPASGAHQVANCPRKKACTPESLPS